MIRGALALVLLVASVATADAERARVRFSLHPGGQTAIWRDPARFKVVVSGRRWGKTHLGRTWLLSQALGGKPGRYWYVAPTREDAKDIMWADIKAACHPDWLAEAPRETELALHLKGGREVRLFSAEKGDALRGRALRALVMDEYADMDASVFHEVLRPSLGDFKAPALFIGTPKSYNHFHALYARADEPANAGRWASWQFKSIQNPFLDPGEIEAARADTDPRTFRQEWEASFEALAGRVYWAFDRAIHVGKAELRHDLPVAVTFDFNYNPATAVIGQKRGHEAVVLHEVFLPFRGGEATIASAMACKAWLAQQGYAGEIRLYGDSTGTSTKTTGPSDHQVLKDVFPRATWCIPTGQPNPRDRHAAVNARCVTADGRHHLVIDRSCVHLVADLERVIYAANGDVDQRSDPNLTHISDAFGYWVHREWPAVKPSAAVAVTKAPHASASMSGAMAAMKARKSAQLAKELGRGV